MSLLELYETNKSEFRRLLDAAVAMDILPEQYDIHKREAAFCDTFNKNFGNRSLLEAFESAEAFCTLRQTFIPSDDIFSAIGLQQASMVEKDFCNNHVFAMLQTTGEKSPGKLFHMPCEEDFKVAHDKILFGRPPEFIKKVVKKIGNVVYGKRNVEEFGISMCMGSIEHDFESALSIEQRAIRFVLIKLVAILKNYSSEWIKEKMQQAHKDRTDKDSESIKYYSDKSFQRTDDPEWKLRYEWLKKCYKLDMTHEERVRYWLKQADNDEFVTSSDDFEEEHWWGEGRVLGEPNRTYEQTERENIEMNSKMADLREKMRLARLKRFA